MANGAGLTPELLKPKTPDVQPNELSDVEADAVAFEQTQEHKDDILHAETKQPDGSAQQATAQGQQKRQPQETEKDEVVIEVEKILEDGIGQFYASLPDQAKPLFKKKGEEASREIAEMVRTLNVQVKRLIQIISSWLKTIPGINKYYLEQEAKIKADRVLDLIQTRNDDESKSV